MGGFVVARKVLETPLVLWESDFGLGLVNNPRLSNDFLDLYIQFLHKQ